MTEKGRKRSERDSLKLQNNVQRILKSDMSLQSLSVQAYCCACSFVCLFVRLPISPARIKLAAPTFARWFVGVLYRESPILGNFSPPEAQNWTNQRASASIAR